MGSVNKTIRILITGCSGGGKSTLLAALAGRGLTVVAEPGRRIIAEEKARAGKALPWEDPVAFVRRAVEMSRTDFLRAGPGLVFFDRGLLDAACALEHLTGVPGDKTLGPLRYDDPVFLAPPWPEIFSQDADRRHGLDAAMEEYHRLAKMLDLLGYRVVVLPKVAVAARVAFVLEQLKQNHP